MQLPLLRGTQACKCLYTRRQLIRDNISQLENFKSQFENKVIPYEFIKEVDILLVEQKLYLSRNVLDIKRFEQFKINL
jgi:hypothetical protein